MRVLISSRNAQLVGRQTVRTHQGRKRMKRRTEQHFLEEQCTCCSHSRGGGGGRFFSFLSHHSLKSANLSPLFLPIAEKVPSSCPQNIPNLSAKANNPNKATKPRKPGRVTGHASANFLFHCYKFPPRRTTSSLAVSQRLRQQLMIFSYDPLTGMFQSPLHQPRNLFPQTSE